PRGFVRSGEPDGRKRRPVGNHSTGIAMSAPKPDPPYASNAEIDELVRLFESCELPGPRGTHRAPLAVAATYLRRYPLPEAIDRARLPLRRYKKARRNP